MILYHILSKKRFDEKLAYANSNNGKLFITPHSLRMDMSQGVIPNYIHCLPYIVGAIPFADREEATIIKIKMSPTAKIWKYKGAQSKVDFSIIESGTDVVHTIYDNEKFFQWQEVLLASNENIESWTADREEIKQDYIHQLEMLRTGEVHEDHFFYRDFSPEEQYDIARLVGHHVGFETFLDNEIRELRQKFDEAYQRIESKYGLSDPS